MVDDMYMSDERTLKCLDKTGVAESHLPVAEAGQPWRHLQMSESTPPTQVRSSQKNITPPLPSEQHHRHVYRLPKGRGAHPRALEGN